MPAEAAETPKIAEAAETAKQAPEPQVDISVIVPVYNGAQVLPRCLEALGSSRNVSWECIVVDDASTDGSAELARSAGARVVSAGLPRSGPGIARNAGARVARGTLLCFIDADVLVRPDTLASFVALFRQEQGIAAAFGSYDDAPGAHDGLSQYRNLLHHFVHQTGRREASTFWSGCGAIRREIFLENGGFSPTYTRPCIEDVELGYRLCAQGLKIRLARYIQVKHLKRWTFWNILKTDILDRAIPWTALISSTGHMPNDLNLGWSGRISAVSVYTLALLLTIGWWQPLAWGAALAPLVALVTCNRDLYAFFVARRGWRFLATAIPMHWLYFAYSTAAFAAGMVFFKVWRPPSGVSRNAAASAALPLGNRLDSPQLGKTAGVGTVESLANEPTHALANA